MMTRGDIVQTWFDTGAMGAQILYGRVIASGAKTYRVRWESSLTNRIRQDNPHIKRAEKPEFADAELTKRGI